MRLRAALSCLALAGVSVLVAAPASAAPQPTCGSTLTVDTSLKADLTCTGPGLTLGPGVTLNLKGHTLRGPASAIGVAVSSEGAITVRNGTLAGWGDGIETFGVPDTETGPLSVDRVTFRRNTVGLHAAGEDGTGLFRKPTTVTRSAFTANDRGLLAEWFVEVTVGRSAFAGNTMAIEVFDSQVDVADSGFVRNATAMQLVQSGTHVQRSTFLDNPRGVAVFPVSGATIEDSRFVGSDVAVGGTGNPTVIHVDDNTFVHNDTGVSYDLSDGTVTGNTFVRNGVGFLSLRAPFDPTLVQDNVFKLNGDGIRVEQGDPLIQVGGNVARRNSGFGIYAPGVTDLGGNRASLNGSEPQCVGVVCTP